MRIIVFFDLPTITYKDRREYLKFRKYLLKDGFIMMQESVYTKLVLNNTVSKLQLERLKKFRPPDGLVEVLIVTEKQFSRIEYITGKKISIVEDSDQRLLIL